LLKLAFKAARLKISLVALEQPGHMELRLGGAATFLKVPALTQVLESVPAGTQLHVPMTHLRYIDHSVMELLEDWARTQRHCGSRLIIEPRGLKRRVEGRLRAVPEH